MDIKKAIAVLATLPYVTLAGAAEAREDLTRPSKPGVQEPGPLVVTMFSERPTVPAQNVRQSRSIEIAQACTYTPVARLDITTDLVLSLAGSVVESLVDALALKLQPETNNLESVVAIDGLFVGDQFVYRDGCLVIHNGDDTQSMNAIIEAAFDIRVSTDSTAMAFRVARWQYNNFAKPKTSAWGQQKGIRDIAIKFEFLSPSSEGLGNRSIFVEHTFQNVDKEGLQKLFRVGQLTPWIALPIDSTPQNKAVHRPVNLKVNFIETTKAGRFAVWAQKAAQDQKAALATLVQNNVRQAIDPAYAATEAAKAAEAAGKAFEEYSAAWNALAELSAKEPADPTSPEGKAWGVKVAVATQAIATKRVLAKQAFSAADIPWPGDLG